MTVAIVPIWLSSITCAVFLALCLIVIYILLRDEIRAWLQERDERKLLKEEQAEEELRLQKLKEKWDKDPHALAVVVNDAPKYVFDPDSGRVYDQDRDV